MQALAFRAAAAGLLFAAWCGSPASAAMDPVAAADALAAAAAAVPGASFTYDAATSDGATVTITGVTATWRETTVATVPVVVISDAQPTDVGGFTAARIGFDGGTITDPRGKVTWATGAIDDVVVPAASEIRDRAKVRPFGALSMGTLLVESPSLAAPIAVASFGTTIDQIADSLPSSVGFTAAGIALPVALIANSIVGVMATMMDYQEFVADLSVVGVYDTDAHTASLEALSIDVPDVGRIMATARASAFSIGAITDPDEEVAKQARADARLEAATVRIENTGIVERFLDMQAQMLGATRDDVRKQIVEGALPFALSFVKNVAFRDQFQAAVATFLADPRSLTIIAEPPEPVPLGQFMRAIARAPTTIPDLLAPRVEANN